MGKGVGRSSVASVLITVICTFRCIGKEGSILMPQFEGAKEGDDII